MVTLDDFPDRTAAENGLIEHLIGRQPGFFKVSDTLPPEKAPPPLHIRASLIRALILRQVTDVPLPERGLQIHGAYIHGDGVRNARTRGLDLQGATLSHDLSLTACRIPDMLLIRSAEFKNLILSNSRLDNNFEGDDIHTWGSLLLNNLTSAGKIFLRGAKIERNFICDNAIMNSVPEALCADRISVKGDVFLRDVVAQGSIRFLEAQLGAGLSCDRSKFLYPDISFGGDRLIAKHNVHLVSLCSDGEIRLAGVQIGGDLYCEGAKLSGRVRCLNLQGAKIEGAWIWRENAYSCAAIDLTIATIGAICDDPACWPPEVMLNRCRYGAFTGTGVDGPTRINWLSLQKPWKYGDDFWPQPYEECARALREAGHQADAREVLIEKERLQRVVRHQALGREIAQTRGANRKLHLWLKRWLLRGGDLFVGGACRLWASSLAGCDPAALPAVCRCNYLRACRPSRRDQAEHAGHPAFE